MKPIDAIIKYKPIIILVLIPICFTLLFGGAMSPVFVSEIPVGVLDLDGSATTRQLIEDFDQSTVISIDMEANSAQQLEEELLKGKIKGALILPQGYEKSLKTKTGAEALMMMDGTNFLIGNNLMLYANKIFTDKNERFKVVDLEQMGMMPFAAEQNFNSLSLTDRTLYNPQLGYFYYLFAGLLGVFIQQTYLNVLTPMLLREKAKLKELPSNPEARRVPAKELALTILQYAGLSIISSMACLIIANLAFDYPLRGNLFSTMLIEVLFLSCLTGVSLVMAAIFDDATHCIQFVMFLAIPTILSSGYGWPEFMMAPGFAKVVKAIWPLYYYCNPMKDLMLKGAELWVIKSYIIGAILFTCFWIPAGILLYRRKIKTMKQIEIQERE